jgi:hypothetical protein
VAGDTLTTYRMTGSKQLLVDPQGSVEAAVLLEDSLDLSGQ